MALGQDVRPEPKIKWLRSGPIAPNPTPGGLPPPQTPSFSLGGSAPQSPTRTHVAILHVHGLHHGTTRMRVAQQRREAQELVHTVVQAPRTASGRSAHKDPGHNAVSGDS